MFASANKRTEGDEAGKVIGYRLGLYDPVDPDMKRVRYVGRTYKAKGRDVALLALIIDRFNHRTAGDSEFRLCLAAYPIHGPTVAHR